MDQFLNDIKSLYFWLAVVVTSIATGLIANYLPKWIFKLFGATNNVLVRYSQKRRERIELLTAWYVKHPERLTKLWISINTRFILGMVIAIGSATFLIVALLFKFFVKDNSYLFYIFPAVLMMVSSVILYVNLEESKTIFNKADGIIVQDLEKADEEEFPF